MMMKIEIQYIINSIKNRMKIQSVQLWQQESQDLTGRSTVCDNQ